MKVRFRIEEGKSIPIFIVNKLSGPQFGESTLEYLYQNLNPIQIIDLLDEGIDRLHFFKGMKDIKVIVAGGDGTMGGLVDPIYEILGRNVMLIPMPLGTGNDLSRALGWGPGVSTTKDVKYFLKYLETKPLPTLFDRWQIKITSKSNPDNVLLDQKMLLYFGIGLDAKFSYQFNLVRKKFPFFFKTRTGNKFFYGQVGTYNLVTEKKMEMNKCLKIKAVDERDREVDIKFDFSSENVIFQNTSFWGGGCFDMWGSYSNQDDDKISITSQDSMKAGKRNRKSGKVEKSKYQETRPQTHSDKLLELVSLRSLFHMGQIQIGMSKADRLYQGK